ncbi:hypothetical protein SAMN04489732_106114 [Amycolatopsis saalfeldensis]|uniref:Uncharacterized protein n=1 Tax=Amycolatopsis saalfeldensis TaxID=394193 RepID=A0A1H8X0I8_9PSEU|nr:hypothetical protein SAMN04489732_106114 [Amycolatopsis saalfeldensis]
MPIPAPLISAALTLTASIPAAPASPDRARPGRTDPSHTAKHPSPLENPWPHQVSVTRLPPVHRIFLVTPPPRV